MTARGNRPEGGRSHRFGGDWTTAKLQILEAYLSAYSAALKNKNFKTAYIDAFAGTGYRALKQDTHQAGLLFPDLAQDAPQGLLDGSARIALKAAPRFDRYIFVEKDPSHCEALENLKTEFPDRSADIDVRQGEANQEIKELCQKNWSKHRAVLFLDPYGMQVEWATIEAIAATRAIDVWILFPLGIGVNRLLTRTGDIPESWRRRLDLMLGTPDWYDAFYTIEPAPTLFEPDKTTLVKAKVEVVGQFFLDRLKVVFAGVAPQSRLLVNSTNCPLYLLCFAVGNPNAVDVALRIAGHLLEKEF